VRLEVGKGQDRKRPDAIRTMTGTAVAPEERRNVTGEVRECGTTVENPKDTRGHQIKRGEDGTNHGDG
jgi:hypothetical protein